MPWSFPGIEFPVEMIYSQTTGFAPDVAVLRCNPQLGIIPAEGTLTLSWDATTVTLPNCVVDIGSSNLTEDGRFIRLKVLDRRERWKLSAPISGEYNTLRVGSYIASRQKTLRQLGTLLMTALGEATADVSALPTTVYPPISWECEDVVKAAQTLFETYGFSVSLGFGAEVVKVVQMGTGAALSTTGRFIGSETIDPKLVPMYVRVCFAPSVAQVRLKLEAVGYDTDGTWQLLDNLSFTPALGWEQTAPYSLPEVDGPDDAGLTAEQLLEAVGYVRRAYRVSGFADETWDLPDGSGSISGLSDILPIKNHLLETENIRPDESRLQFKVYGAYHKLEDETGQPPVPGGLDTLIGDRVTGRHFQIDGENGIVFFNEPIWRIVGSEYKPADLWLEATIQVRNQTYFSWNHYEKDTLVAAGGSGYHTIKDENRAETIVSYDSSHVVTGTSTNQTSLDALAAAWSVVAAASYSATDSVYVVYPSPVLTLRCDGAILQVQHVLTCGELGHAVNRTTASRHFEFDRGIPSRHQRIAHLQAMSSAVAIDEQTRARIRKENADD